MSNEDVTVWAVTDGRSSSLQLFRSRIKLKPHQVSPDVLLNTMKLFEITVKIVKVDDEDKPVIGWMKPLVLYPVYSIFNRTEKVDHPPGFKITTWLLVAEKDGKRLDWINASAIDYAGE